MPCAGGMTPKPGDTRITTWDSHANITSGASWEAGFFVACTSTAHFVKFTPSATIVLGDGDTAYYTVELNIGTTNPAAAIALTMLGNTSLGAGTNCHLQIYRNSGSPGNIFGRFIDESGNNHDTPTSTYTAGRNVYGVSVKRYQSGGNWVVDVTLRDITGGVDLATLTASVLTGTNTVTFQRHCRAGVLSSLGKGGTIEIDVGVQKLNVSSAVALRSGNAWAQADVDNVKTRLVTDAAATRKVAAVGLLTMYDTSASGDGWPTTSTVIDWRLPTGDSTPLQWAPDSGTTHYTQVDDAFGSYSETDYVTDATAGHVDEYSYTALSLSGKTVLCVGMTARGPTTGNNVPYLGIDFSGVTSDESTQWDQVLQTVWWDKAPVAATGHPRSFAVII